MDGAVLAAVHVEPAEFLAVAGTAAVAGTIAAVVTGRGLLLPAVVVELLFGVIIGPQVLGLEVSEFLQFFADLGLGMLFFFAGYEIDLRRISGRPLRLGAIGWAISLALAYAIGGILAAAGVVVSLLYTGSAIATTAIGTLIPILSDSGELKTRFGTLLLGAGAVGEFGPILLITLVLSTGSALHHAAILIAFVALAIGVALLAVRSSGRSVPLFERTLEKSSQIAVRWIVVLVFALALLASELGLDLLLGGFAAGLITRQVLKDARGPGVRLEALGGRLRRLHPVLLRRQRDAARRRRAVRERVRRGEARSCSSGSSSSCAARRRSCSTGTRSPTAATASRSRCSAPRSFRSCSRSRRSRRTAGTCGRRPPRRWSGPPCSRRSSIRSSACGSAATPPVAPPARQPGLAGAQ